MILRRTPSARTKLDHLLGEHPLFVVVVLGVSVWIWQIWMVLRVRHIGSFNLDEAGYLAQAFGMQRGLADGGPSGLIEMIGVQSGPLVPFLSSLLLLTRPRSLLVAMAIQPMLAVVTAVAVAGIVRRLAGPWAAIAAGVVTLGLPVLLVSARGYQLSVGATAFMSVAVWMLITADGGRNDVRMAMFGASTVLMLLARTMTLGFVPGLLVAAVVQVWAERTWRRSFVFAVGGIAGVILLATPWWISGGADAMTYLLRNGYSQVADRYGSGPLPTRVLNRFLRLLMTVRPMLLVPAIGLWIGAITSWVRNGIDRRSIGVFDASPIVEDLGPDGPQPSSSLRRDLLTVALPIVLGYVALVTTNNEGTDFDLPLIVLGVALTASLIVNLRSIQRKIWGGLAVAIATVNIFAVGNVALGTTINFDDGPDPVATASSLLFAGSEGTQTEFASADQRFAWGSSRAQRLAASNEWWSVNAKLTWAFEQIEESVGRDVVRTITGSAPLLSANSLLLSGEVNGHGGGWIQQVDHGDEPEDFLRLVKPTVAGRPNILVIIEARRGGFADPELLGRQRCDVERQGWYVQKRVLMPDGGTATILRYPDSEPSQSTTDSSTTGSPQGQESESPVDSDC